MNTAAHPFITRPHKTLLGLSLPVLLSLTAEPITALVDTAFISSLGVVPLAALGVGSFALSLLFSLFNFLGVGTQTEIAQILGKGESSRAGQTLSLALTLAAGIGILLILSIFPAAPLIARALGASGAVQENAVQYMQIRLFGAPAVLLMLTTYGALRGLQDMRTPLWIALGVNALNIILDWILVFGQGPFPVLGVGGSALASTISQWVGALAGIVLVSRKLGISRDFDFRDVKKLLRVGGDLFIRTLVLTIFLLLTTRAANKIGPEAGAAHHVINRMWSFTALALDAYAATVQSLVGYFIGQDSITQVKKVVRVALSWNLGTGFLLGGLMWWGQNLVINILVPAASISVFLSAWGVFAISLPINSLAFLTDGVHWGTGDFQYLRNAMLFSSAVGISGLWLVEIGGYGTLFWVWVLIGIWISFRTLFGMIRIWPGIGKSIFRIPN